MGRATQGVRLMDLGEGERLVAMARLAEPDSDAGHATELPAPGADEGAEDDGGDAPDEPAS
jgi:hypothetical protein